MELVSLYLKYRVVRLNFSIIMKLDEESKMKLFSKCVK